MNERQYGEDALKLKTNCEMNLGEEELDIFYAVHVDKLSCSQGRKLELMAKFGGLERHHKVETLQLVFQLNRKFHKWDGAKEHADGNHNHDENQVRRGHAPGKRLSTVLQLHSKATRLG
jgi:hypothetical protein